MNFDLTFPDSSLVDIWADVQVAGRLQYSFREELDLTQAPSAMAYNWCLSDQIHQLTESATVDLSLLQSLERASETFK